MRRRHPHELAGELLANVRWRWRTRPEEIPGCRGIFFFGIPTCMLGLFCLFMVLPGLSAAAAEQVSNGRSDALNVSVEAGTDLDGGGALRSSDASDSSKEPPPVQGAEWSVADCLRAALTNSPELVQKRLDVMVAVAKGREARSARMPQMKFQTQLTAMKPFIDPLRISTTELLDALGLPVVSSLPPPYIEVDVMPSKFLSTTVQMTQPLFTSGKIHMGIRLADLNRQLEESLLAGSGLETAYVVRQLYLALVMGKETLTLLGDMIEETGKILTDTQAMLEQGLVSQSDLLSAESNLRQLEEELANTAAEMVRAREGLRLLTGADENDPLEVMGRLSDLPTGDQPPLATLLQEAVQKRPEVETRAVQRGLADANVSFVRADSPFRPTLGAQLEGGFRGDRWPVLQTNWTMAWDVTYTVSMALQMNLFDGGKSRAKVQQALANKRQAELGSEQTLALIRSQVRESYARVESRERATARAEAQRLEHEEKYRVAQLDFRTGTLGRAEYLAQHLLWSQARATRLMVLFELHNAYLGLEHAVGRLPRTAAEVRDQ